MHCNLSPKETDVVVLCGGKGTRLGPLTREIPKPLLDIGEVPFLLHLLSRFRKEGFERFILAVHYLSDRFEIFAKKYRNLFPNIEIVVEKKAMGTGGALRNAVESVASENFIALNGDIFVTQKLQPVLNYHAEQRNGFTMVVVRTKNVEGEVRNKGGIVIDANNDILSFSGHSQTNEKWVNAGMYVAQKRKVARWPFEKYDLEKEFFSLMRPEKGNAFRSEAKLLDIGTSECFRLAKEKYEDYTASSC